MTYSIVARDPDTGELGVAVQSHYFATGSIVTWAEAGVGAVATQAMAEVAYGPRLLDDLRSGTAPLDALAARVTADRGRDTRQVALVDHRGRVAVHTGASCIGAAGHATGEGWSTQANMMWRSTVWDAMAEGFGRHVGPLAERLLAALRAGEAAGGDLRGRQSAALLVVPAEGERWQRTVDLRVDDHPDPLEELDRLLRMRWAYTEGQHRPVMGSNPELRFWNGVAAAADGRVAEARRTLEDAYSVSDGWRELVRRLPAAGRLPDDPALIEALTGEPDAGTAG